MEQLFPSEIPLPFPALSNRCAVHRISDVDVYPDRGQKSVHHYVYQINVYFDIHLWYWFNLVIVQMRFRSMQVSGTTPNFKMNV